MLCRVTRILRLVDVGPLLLLSAITVSAVRLGLRIICVKFCLTPEGRLLDQRIQRLFSAAYFGVHANRDPRDRTKSNNLERDERGRQTARTICHQFKRAMITMGAEYCSQQQTSVPSGDTTIPFLRAHSISSPNGLVWRAVDSTDDVEGLRRRFLRKVARLDH